MNSELDAANDGELPRRPEQNQVEPTEAEQHPCANCGTPLIGEFCHHCGQTAHIHNSLLHLVEEALHGILHFDAKAWRTLPALLLRPGQLTRDYIDGHRTRYVSPLAMFLFLVFLMFFVFSYIGKEPDFATPGEQTNATARSMLENNIAESKAELASIQEQVRSQTKPAQELKLELLEAENNLRKQEEKLQLFDTSTGAKKDALALDITQEGRFLHELSKLKLHSNTALGATINHAFQNPELLLYKLRSTASSFAFLLVPISLPFLWLLFVFRRDVRMYDHAVFSLYSLSFMALLFVALTLLNLLGLSNTSFFLLLILPPLHMFQQLRGTYRLRFGETLWRTIALMLIAGGVFLLFLFIVAALTVR